MENNSIVKHWYNCDVIHLYFAEFPCLKNVIPILEMLKPSLSRVK